MEERRRSREQLYGKLGGYSSADMDRAFLRSQRSDPTSVALRLVTLAFVYGFMARSVVVHDVGAGFLLIPLAFEWLLANWLGYFLGRFVVDCHRFREASGKLSVIVGWTVGIGLITIVVLKVGSPNESLATSWAAGVATVISSGLIWALVAETVGLIASTVPEVRRWKREGGSFDWTSVTSLGLRFAVLLVLFMVGIFLMILLATPIAAMFSSAEFRIAWLVFGFLLVLDLGALVLGVVVHRMVMAEAAQRATQ